MAKQIQLLAPSILQIKNIVDQDTATIEFDADGGTGSAGLLTLTDDAGADAFDFGLAAFDTLQEVVDAIEALSSWQARRFTMGPEILAISGAIDTSETPSPWDDIAAATQVPRNRWVSFIDYTDDFVTIPISGVRTLIDRALPIDCATLHFLHIQHVITPSADATGATVDFEYFGASATNFEDDISDAEFDNLALDDSPFTVTVAAAAEVRQQFEVNSRGLQFFKLGAVTNNSGVVTMNISGQIQGEMKGPDA